MAILKCKMCGGNLEVTEGMNVCECEYCGSRQTVPSVDDEKKITLFTRANRLRIGCEFDKAFGVYESIVAEFPEEAEAYWGLVLCKYGIEYVDDPKTGKKIPTCHRSSFDSVFEDSDFEMVMEYSDTISRSVYREEAKAIETIRVGIVEVSSKEEPYDIFICYKETAEDGQRTIDSVLAQDVYDELTSRGYKVFFSRITLEDKLGVEYEPYIFAALNSAKIMLAFGTDYEYYNAVWVKNEWSRFLSLIAKGEKKTLIPCYKDIDAYDMPAEFKRLQAQDMGKVGATQDLIRGIEKIIGKKGEAASATTSGGSTGALTKRAYLYLEDKDFEKAIEYFEKGLDENPEDGSAYLGGVLAKSRVQTLEELEALPISLESIPYYAKAIRFSIGAQQARLQSVLADNKKKTGSNRELADNVVHGDIKKLMSLAPVLISIVENLKGSEYEGTLGVSKTEVDEALVKYEVFKTLETSGVPMNTDDIKSADEKLSTVDIKLIRSALVEINNDGYIAFDNDNKKFSFISEAFRVEKERVYKSECEEKIAELQKDIDFLAGKIAQETEQISADTARLERIKEDSSELLAEVESKKASDIYERRQAIAGIHAKMQKITGELDGKRLEYNTMNANFDALLGRKSAMERELGSLSFFQGKKKKELQEGIAAVVNQIQPAENALRAKTSEIETLDSKVNALRSEVETIENEIACIEDNDVSADIADKIRKIENLIELSETEKRRFTEKKNELEAEVSEIRAKMDSYEWKPEPIDKFFRDGCEGGDMIYEYIMDNFYKTGENVKAIKYYREQTGVGLREAKDAIDAMFAGRYIPKVTVRVTPTDVSNVSGKALPLDAYIKRYYDKNSKVQAIKYYREKTGLGLREAKDAVDRLLGY